MFSDRPRERSVLCPESSACSVITNISEQCGRGPNPFSNPRQSANQSSPQLSRDRGQSTNTPRPGHEDRSEPLIARRTSPDELKATRDPTSILTGYPRIPQRLKPIAEYGSPRLQTGRGELSGRQRYGPRPGNRSRHRKIEPRTVMEHLEPPTRIELVTSVLPRLRSTN